MKANFKKLKNAHSELVSKYIDVLNELPTLPFFVPSRSSVRKKNPPSEGTGDLRGSVNNQQTKSFSLEVPLLTRLFSLQFLVRLFVESHIRAKLLELSVAYSYLAQKHLSDKAYALWLRETSADCSKLAETLTSLQSVRGVVSIWWPVIISIVTTWLGLETIYDLLKKIPTDARGWILFGLIIVFPLMYMSFFISFAFASKRELFMPGFDRAEIPLDPNQPADVGGVIYVLEDQVFPLTEQEQGP